MSLEETSPINPASQKAGRYLNSLTASRERHIVRFELKDRPASVQKEMFEFNLQVVPIVDELEVALSEVR